jgi:signal transduction histidine kinase
MLLRESFSRLSLANKCLLMFGGGLTLIIFCATWIPWLRMNRLVDVGQLEVSRQMARVWDTIDQDNPARPGESADRGGVVARRVPLERARAESAQDPFLADAIGELSGGGLLSDFQRTRWLGATLEYRYARADRAADGSLTGLIVLDRRSIEATRLLLVNWLYLFGMGLPVLLVALAGFWVLTNKLILRPVRELRGTAERVRSGDTQTRSEIRTGDEFQELSETFNLMLADLRSNEGQLRAKNEALDLKLTELTASNDALAEAARLKGEFLSSVSHELRTPLNSIIGFAELLHDLARADAGSPAPPASVTKRLRYVEIILGAGRHLLDMINALLEMAKLEAGRVEVSPERVDVRSRCGALLTLIGPLASRRGVTLRAELEEHLPAVVTDAGKFEQIIFNFLSNAVKFVEPEEKTGRAPQVTLRAERLVPAGPSGGGEQVRVSVIDNGPGIPPEAHARVFEKFVQLDGGYNREHAGTGLGLSICRELASILQGEIQLVSDVGRGSMFSLILPLELDMGKVPLAKQKARERAAERLARV